ncbi:MAG: hypothetical protein CMB49_04145 [Euryarchaeota archaeon]|nr:hypothetical protein [Euryarchaeota archaeon]
MSRRSLLAIFQIVLIVGCSVGVWLYYENNKSSQAANQSGAIVIEDSNEIKHYFDQPPERVAITNTYAANVMRMLEVDMDVVVGVSGDFYDETLWPEFVETPLVQYSAHSEIDFESLLDTRPEVYIVFATNGMVDTNAIRAKLEPVNIKVVALDFYKYDSLRYEIGVIAKMFDRQQQADAIFEEFNAIESIVEERISMLDPSDRPEIVMEHHASLTRDPVVLTGTSQWNDLIELAGGVNIFSHLPGHTTHVDIEAIIGEDPDIIMFDGITFEIGFNEYDPDDKCGTHMEFIADRAGFENVQAIQNDMMIIMAGEFAGPMMIHGLPTLAKLLHPELFSDFDSEKYLDDYYSKYHNIERSGKFYCSSLGG